MADDSYPQSIQIGKVINLSTTQTRFQRFGNGSLRLLTIEHKGAVSSSSSYISPRI